MKEHYKNLDGLRAYACIGIIMMHVLNNGYNTDFSGFVFQKLIPSFTELIFLFFILSSFSLCCGYYDRFASGSYDLEKFYLRRIQRIWPCFAVLCTIELLLGFETKLVYEWLADLTLAYGLIPNSNISVVGVGWFLGVIFVFYMVFPFFVFLLKNKKRAWLSLAVAVLISFICQKYFISAANRSVFVFDAMFFVSGGLIFLYKDQLSKKIRIISLAVFACTAVISFMVPTNYFLLMIVFSSLIIWSVSANDSFSTLLLQNRIVLFIGSISMEMYLCHMFIYRTIEKLGLHKILPDHIANYFLVVFATVAGAAVFSLVLKRGIEATAKLIASTRS